MTGGDPLDETLESGAALPERFADRYRLLRPLGRGASKDVYLAHDERLDRDVALALLKGGTRTERVRREMQVTGRLGEHPHVVTVHDAGEHDGLTYLVLRALEGGSLASRLREAAGGRLPVEDVSRIGAQIAAGLSHAHASGIVHRDVKPENVWLDADGRAVLGDFGVARDDRAAGRLTAERAVVGTLAYLSPEQARGEPARPASDLYGLGATLYELACGRPPFLGESAEALVAQHLQAAPEPPSAHEPAAAPLDELILRLLAKDPADRPESAAAVAAELSADAPAVPRAGRGFVGREGVTSVLRAACDDALAGRVTVVALSGEPGIGKSRCAEELAAYARRNGAAVAWGTCLEEEGAPAYWPWRRVLRELAELVDARDDAAAGALLAGGGEALAPEADAEQARLALWDAVAAHLQRAASARPLLVVIDDAHWADPSSLGLLVHLSRALRGARVLLLLTHRAPPEPLTEALGRLSAAGAYTAVELEGLGADEVERLAGAVARRPVPPGVAATLRERTRGNPLYVAELVRALVADERLEDAADAEVPSGLRAIIARRAAALPERCRRLVEFAAVAGTEFSLSLVARAAGSERGAALASLEPALREQLVAHAGGARYRFEHAIARDAVYDAQPLALRAERHARFAGVLEERRAREPDQPVAEIAHHAVMAARGGLDAAPALRWSREAATEAANLLAYEESAGHLDRALEALELGELGTAAERLELLLESAGTHAAAYDLDESQRRYRAAAEVARRLGDPQAFARAALGYAEFQHYGMVDAPALALLEEARRGLPAGDSVLHAHVLGRLAVRLDRHTQQDRREALLDEAIGMARRVGDREALARLLALSPLVNWRPESRERRRSDAAEVLALAEAVGDREAALWTRLILHVERLAAGDIPGADRELAAFGRMAVELGQRYYRWNAKILAASRAVFDGRLADGRRLGGEAVADNRVHESDSEQEWVALQLVLARLTGRGDVVPLDALRGFAERYPELPVWRAQLALGEWVAGDRDAARAALEACTPRGPAALASDPDRICTLSLLAEVSAAVGDLRRGAELYPLLAPYAAANVLTDRSWAAWGAAARPLGCLAASLGRPEEAARHFEQAVELNRRWGSRPWLVHTVLDFERALPGVPARSLVEEAEELGRRLGLQHPSSTKPPQ